MSRSIPVGFKPEGHTRFYVSAPIYSYFFSLQFKLEQKKKKTPKRRPEERIGWEGVSERSTEASKDLCPRHETPKTVTMEKPRKEPEHEVFCLFVCLFSFLFMLWSLSLCRKTSKESLLIIYDRRQCALHRYWYYSGEETICGSNGPVPAIVI